MAILQSLARSFAHNKTPLRREKEIGVKALEPSSSCCLDAFVVLTHFMLPVFFIPPENRNPLVV